MKTVPHRVLLSAIMIALSNHLLAEDAMPDLTHLHWLGHATFQITGSRNIYIDPYQLSRRDSADIILITHDHRDHLSLPDIDKLRGPQTIVVLPRSVAAPPQLSTRTIAAGETLTLQEVTIEAVPAYNIGKRFHPQERGFLGYIVTVDGCRYYHAGDTDQIPEMAQLRVDVALLPVGGTYTMNAAEAARAAAVIKPRIAIPMHWGTIVGDRTDAELFQKQCPVAVQIMTPER